MWTLYKNKKQKISTRRVLTWLFPPAHISLGMPDPYVFLFLMFQGTSRHGNSHIRSVRERRFGSWTLPGCTQGTVCFYVPADNRDWHHPSLWELSPQQLTDAFLKHGSGIAVRYAFLWIETRMHLLRPTSPHGTICCSNAVIIWDQKLTMKCRTDICVYWCKIYLFWLITPSFKWEMLIMFRSDPSRCVDCCIHLYLFFSQKDWVVVRTFEGSFCFDHANSLWWLCSTMMLGDGRDCVFKKWSLFLKITWEFVNEEMKGKAKKPRAVLASETKPCVDELGFKPDCSNKCSMCMPRVTAVRVWSLRTQQCVIVSAIQLDSSASLWVWIKSKPATTIQVANVRNALRYLLPDVAH